MTPSEARQEIFELFNTAWTAGASTSSLDLFFQGVRDDVDATPDANGVAQAYGRISVVHTAGRQVSVGGPARRFERFGTVVVQLRAPRGESLTAQMDDMVEVSLAAFEGKSTPNGVWFRDVTPNEVGISPEPNGPWYQVNIIAGFRYDQVR